MRRYGKSLISYLHELFGDRSTSPDLVVNGPRIILDSTAFGLKNAEELGKVLIGKGIRTKPVTVYISPNRAGGLSDRVQMTMPWEEDIMAAVLKAFQEIKAELGIVQESPAPEN